MNDELDNIKRQIEETRKKLHDLLVKEQDSTSKILKISECLDLLILEYYKLKEQDKED